MPQGQMWNVWSLLKEVGPWDLLEVRLILRRYPWPCPFVSLRPPGSKSSSVADRIPDSSFLHSSCNLQFQARELLVHVFSVNKTARWTEELFQPQGYEDTLLSYLLEVLLVYFSHFVFSPLTIDFYVCCGNEESFFKE